MRRKIFFDATPIIDRHISGVGKVLLETLRALDTEYYKQKYDIFMFVPINEINKLKRFSFRYIKVKWLPYPHKFFGLFSRFRFGPPIDLFLGRGVYVFENYRNWNLLFSKSITYIHDPAFKLFPEYIRENNLRYLTKYIDLWVSRSNRIVTVSESARDDIINNIKVGEVEVVRIASDSDMRPRSKKEISSARKKWEIPENYYMYLGSIEPRKNLANLVRAFRNYSLKNSNKEALVLVGGDGWNNEEIYQEIELSRKAGVSIIRPDKYVPDEDIPALLSGAIAVLQLSWHEGFGMSVLHGLACGAPVVAADIPSLREASNGNWDNVIFVDPANISEIARAIKEVRNKAHTKLPRDIPSWSQSVRELERIIDSL